MSRKITFQIFIITADTYHCCVISCEAECRNKKGPSSFPCLCSDSLPQAGICRHAACNSNCINACKKRCLYKLTCQNADYCMLKRSAQIIPVLFNKIRVFLKPVPQKIEEVGFQSAEAEIQAGFEKRKAFISPSFASLSIIGPAG